MRYVAINTAGPVIEIAAVYDTKKQYVKLEKVQTSPMLLPAIDRLLDEMQLTLNDFDFFVCVVGPGSFTGLRIGINTVNTFAYALKKSAFGVTYNRLLAYNKSGRCLTLADGGKEVCYAATYDGDETIEEPHCILKKDVTRGNADSVVSDYETDFSEMYEADGRALMLAAEYAIKNKTGTQPLYIRKPQPDRKGSDI